MNTRRARPRDRAASSRSSQPLIFGNPSIYSGSSLNALPCFALATGFAVPRIRYVISALRLGDLVGSSTLQAQRFMPSASPDRRRRRATSEPRVSCPRTRLKLFRRSFAFTVPAQIGFYRKVGIVEISRLTKAATLGSAVKVRFDIVFPS
jgi:hypothetical protein